MATDWPDGLCSCFSDCGSCCLGCLCLCCVLSDNAKRVDNPDSCFKGCFGTKMSEFWVRQTIRRRMNMRENCCGDCCVACTCLLPLAACQTNRALKNGFGTPLPGEGYYGKIAKPKEEPATNVVVQQAYAPPPQQAYYAQPPPPPPQ